MAKALAGTEGTITIPSSGVIAPGTWRQESGLVDCSEKHGLVAEIKVTFANATYDGDTMLYTVGALSGYSTTSGTTDITTADNACPIAEFTAVTDDTVSAVIEIPKGYADAVGFMVKNNDSTENVTVSITYKTVTL